MHRNQQLRLAILQKFPTQSDFALAQGIHESKVSQVIRGRRKLSRNEAEKWCEALECEGSVFEGVTVDD
jgi:DNA-binding transcriptional regulator YdaS (Cro superfamily)